MKKEDDKDDKKNKKAPPKAKNEIDLEPETTDDNGQKIAEEYVLEGDFSDINELEDILKSMHEDLSVAQRLQKRRVMKRYKSKIKIARKRAMKRKANRKVLTKRARRQAVTNVKKFIAKGRNLKDASASEKNRIERMVKRRKNMVTRLTRRLINTKRADERKRFQKSSQDFHGQELVEIFNTLYNTVTEEK